MVIKKARRMLLLGLALVCATIFPFSASAYKTNGRWLSSNSMLTFIAHEGFGDVSFQHMNDAMYQWRLAIGDNRMKRDPYSRHNKTDYDDNSVKDGMNYIYRKSVNSAYVGQTKLRTDFYAMVLEADININVKHPFVNSAIPGKYDFFSVFLHELGHVAGLDHPDDPEDLLDAVMHEHADKMMNSTSYRKLRADDINGVQAIYN